MRCIWCSNPEGMKCDGGTDITASKMAEEIISCRPMFFSGGGVTFTGGEATLWTDELIDCLKIIKQYDIHTAIETNGTSNRLCELLGYIDYLIMDFKHFDGDIHKRYTGYENTAIKMNYETNCKNKRQQHIRIPLINGINTESPEEFAKYFSAFDNSETVFEFLPYHEYGKDKWTEKYQITDGFVPEEKLNVFISVFKEYNLKVVNT